MKTLPKFKKEMKNGFKTNKVRREDQVKKLRENLFDQPKTMIPYNIESINDAWKILHDMYGDSTRVMNAKVLELRNLKENANSGYPRKGEGISLLKAQIEWITRLEVTLNDIMELGEESKQLNRDAFSSRTVVSVLELFKMQDELEREMRPAKEDGKERMYLIIKYLQDLRKMRLEMQKTQELCCGSGSSGKARGKFEIRYEGTDGSTEEYKGKKNEDKKNPDRFGVRVVAKTSDNCKICKYFESHPKKLRGSKRLFTFMEV